jgi:hypothetical protein
MDDYRRRIDECENWRDLTALLDDLALEVDRGLASPYEDEAHLNRMHDLELLRRYGEHKLERLLA